MTYILRIRNVKTNAITETKFARKSYDEVVALGQAKVAAAKAKGKELAFSVITR